MKNKKLKETTKTKVKDLWVCERCNINSTSKDRMIPCPRGGCEAEVGGTIEITTTIKINQDGEV